MTKQCNKSGMTLVEIIVAMTLLAIMSTMFIVGAVGARKVNAENYKRSEEMYTQAVDAEQYNNNYNYDVDKIRVNKYNGKSGTDNAFKLEADFCDSIVWSTDSYAFKAKLNSVDEDAGYQLKFLQGKDSSVSPNVSNGVYWVKFYNDSGTDLANFAETPELTGGKFFDANNNSSGNHVMLNTVNGSISQFGVIIGSIDYFAFTENAGIYDAATHTPSISDFVINSTNFDKFCEEKDGTKTGFIVIHYTGGNTYLNQAEFDATTP